MSQEYLLSLTANEIDQRLNNAVLSIEQTFSAEEKKQIKKNLDINEIPDIINDNSGKLIYLNDSSNYTLQNLKLFGKTIQNGIPTSSTPIEMVNIGNNGTINVSVTGKNVVKLTKYSTTPAGINYTVNSNDSITINGTATATSQYIFKSFYLEPGEYIFSGIPGASSGVYYLTGNDGETRFNLYSGEDTKITISNGMITNFRIVVIKDKTVSNVTYYPMIRHANIADGKYEQYIGQTLTVITPNGLPGIPVNSNGNYVDENGQEWICDDIDLANGIYTKRLNTIEQYAGENIGEIYLSSTGDLSIGATIIYPLQTPITVPLTDEELSIYSTLHTNYPNTVIFNDGGAYMEIQYAADIKNYIDNKINNLLSNK